MAEEAAAQGIRSDRWLLALLAAGLGVRIAAAVLTDPSSQLIADDRLYLEGARGWLEDGELEIGGFVRPPLYFAVLIGTWCLSEPWGLSWILTTKLLQCVVGTATALPVYTSARRLAGERAARFAAALLLFDPTLIAYSHLLWPETMAAFVTALIFDGISRLEPGGYARPLALGALTGLAMLFKPVFGLFTVVLAASWLLRLGLRRGLWLSVVFGSATALVVSPWVVRNQLRYGPEILLENQGPYNFWLGNHLGPASEVFYHWWSLGDPVVRSRTAVAKGLEAIRAEPATFASRYAIRALNLWGLEYFVVRNITMGGYGRVGKGTVLFWFWPLQLSCAFVLLAAAAGLVSISRDPHMRVVLGYAVLFTLVVSAMVTTTRFRVPLSFLLAVSGGIGLAQVLDRSLPRRGMVAVGLAAALLAASATRPVFRQIATASFETRAELRDSEWIYFRY